MASREQLGSKRPNILPTVLRSLIHLHLVFDMTRTDFRPTVTVTHSTLPQPTVTVLYPPVVSQPPIMVVSSVASPSSVTVMQPVVPQPMVPQSTVMVLSSTAERAVMPQLPVTILYSATPQPTPPQVVMMHSEAPGYQQHYYPA